jgi:toxin CcdB
MAAPRRLEVWRVSRGRLVLNVQSDLLSIGTFVVVPLVPADSFIPVEGINPTVEVAGARYILIMQQITAIKASEMRERVAYLPETESMVVKALDRLLTTA